MRRTILTCVVLTLALTAFGQRHRDTQPVGGKTSASKTKAKAKPKPKSKPTYDPDATYFDPIAEDEILFKDAEYLRFPGWRLVARSKEDSNKRSINTYHDYYRTQKTNGKPAQAWIKYVNEEKGLEQGYTIALAEFDCTAQRRRILQFTEYDKDGHIVTSLDSETRWNRITPDTLDEEFYNVICEGQIDLEEYEMREAAKYFLVGRVQEKGKNFTESYKSYQLALELAPNNKTILAGLERVRPKPSP